MAYCGGRTCITIVKPSQLKSEVNITPSDGNFDFSEALESVYPLLEMVLSYLDYDDLQVAAKVKESWQSAALRTLERRNHISWMSSTYRKRRHTVVHFSPNYGFCNVKLGLVLYNYKKVSLSDSFYCHTTNTKHNPKKLKFRDFLAEEVVPKGVKYCVMACPSVSSIFPRTMIKKPSLPLFDAFFIPDIPNVKVSLFDCNPRKMRDDYLECEYKIRALLMFCKNNIAEDILKIFEHLIPEQECRSVALGGGIISKATCFPQTKDGDAKFNNLCIAFTEKTASASERSFSAQSVVITGYNLSSDQFERELIEFKRKIILRSNSMAFRICCSGKWKKGHESKIFHKHFPDTPLIGLEAEGEIGWNSFDFDHQPNDSNENASKKIKKGYPTCQYEWSTVIVVISWGNIIPSS